MLKEYSSNARKLHVNRTLKTLRLRSFMEAINITDVSTGLTKLVYKINQLFPQSPSASCDAAHKTDHLTKAVLATKLISLTDDPIKSVVTPRISFNSLLTALNEALQRKLQLDMLTQEMDRHHGLLHIGFIGRRRGDQSHVLWTHSYATTMTEELQ